MKNKTEKAIVSFESIQTQAITRNYEIFIIIKQEKKNTSDVFLLFVVEWNQQNLYAEKTVPWET